MKKNVVLVSVLITLLSCKKDKILFTDSTEMLQEPAWATEKFKEEYTIQFPDFYSGGYIQSFERGTFNKSRNNSGATFFYSFSNGLQTFDFGDTLADENTESIDVKDGDVLTFLPQKMNFTQNGAIAGILFYNEVWSICRGELYWKDDGVFKDALTIYYSTDLKDEVISILKTINHN